MSEGLQSIVQEFEEPIQGLPPQPTENEAPKLIISIEAQAIPLPNPDDEPTL
jgi:hypothetical protein